MTKILAIQGSDLKKVNIRTDTTLMLAAEAQKRGYKIYYFEPKNLSFLNFVDILLLPFKELVATIKFNFSLNLWT